MELERKLKGDLDFVLSASCQRVPHSGSLPSPKDMDRIIEASKEFADRMSEIAGMVTEEERNAVRPYLREFLGLAAEVAGLPDRARDVKDELANLNQAREEICR